MPLRASDLCGRYIVGREKVITCYQRLWQPTRTLRDLRHPGNWSSTNIPTSWRRLKQWPQIEPVWLPTTRRG